jgi:ribosome biogenesis GTPase / thiamine phosphate phosphatase
VVPIIVLTKTDLINEQSKNEIIESINQRLNSISVFAISNDTQEGYKALKLIIEKGKTFCMLGSSGVEKCVSIKQHQITRTLSYRGFAK